MGMFTNDILYGGLRLDKEFRIGDLEGADPGEKFILLDAHVLSTPVPTSIGDARKTVLRVHRLDPETNLPAGDVFDVGTLAQAIASKVDQKEDGDLPAVVRCHMAEARSEEFSDATVMTFVSGYDGPSIDYKPFDETGTVGSSARGRKKAEG